MRLRLILSPTAPFIFHLVKRGNCCLINIKDVIKLRVPYPDATSELARKSHMYICIGVPDPFCELIKCQSFKPYHLLQNSAPVHRIVEQPDINRNPFRHPTVIDLDKRFSATRSLFPDQLKAVRGISDALLTEIQGNICDTVERVALSDAELKAINPALP